MSEVAYILLNGPSIAEFSDHIHHCKDDDVQWCSVNRFKQVEENILSKIDKKFDLLYCGSWSRFKEFAASASEFNGILVTNSNSFVRAKISYDKVIVSDWGFGYNSLTALILTLVIRKIKKIYIFGADGGGTKDKMYYAQDKIEDNFADRMLTVSRDTDVMNRSFWRFYEDMLLEPIPIINVTSGSRMTCFKTMDYNTFLKEKNGI